MISLFISVQVKAIKPEDVAMSSCMIQNKLHFFIPIKIFQATGMYCSLIPLCIWDQK